MKKSFRNYPDTMFVCLTKLKLSCDKGLCFILPKTTLRPDSKKIFDNSS